ncbi:MAG: radical SAM protein [Desulfobulbaceae bacterium]|uniref:Radical SAM protein n=1 Tax=Candidatus Desulfobia pelagia TaxID=2841692 RepID=A0A8J6NDS6_9BACT|nr:radical SAM protein [Candidatus Desulfobia pelagia]
MELMREALVLKNEKEYGELYRRLRFPSAAEADDFNQKRQQLIAGLDGRASSACQGSKLHTGPLSPGCAICTRGEWSCLFINNLCNGRCFYCPTSQLKKSQPETNSLSFSQANDYLAYLEEFDFRGASISGGEPLITPERTLDFVAKIKKKFGQKIHLWLYTNGILANEIILRQLADHGLDEIRFDLSAKDYETDKVEIAARLIPTITVEIPAIPEDYPLLSGLLPRLAEIGVKHLNLHQLRLTPFNAEKLLQHPYTYSHGKKITVIESELTALRLVRHAAENGGPAVNYCSFAYKERYQGAASRKRAARALAKPFEEVTKAGYIRSLNIKDTPTMIDKIAAILAESGHPQAWFLEKKEWLHFASFLLPEIIRCHPAVITVSYALCKLGEKNSYQGSYLEIALHRKRNIVAQRQSVLSKRSLIAADLEPFAAAFLLTSAQENDDQLCDLTKDTLTYPDLGDIFEYERQSIGLPLYF